MGSLFSTPKPQETDTSYLDQQTKEREEDKAKTERENKARLRASRSRRSGDSPFLFGTTQGVTSDTKETTLG